MNRRHANRRNASVSPDADADSRLEQLFRARYRDADYYSTGREWSDYAPAYRYGRDAFSRHCGRRFEEVERTLAQEWNDARAPSRLAWVEARGAVHEAWQQAELLRPHGKQDT